MELFGGRRAVLHPSPARPTDAENRGAGRGGAPDSVRTLKTIRRSTDLPIPADEAWALVQRADTFTYVTKPLLGVRDPLPETLGEGETLTLRLKILGIPANRHTLHLTEVDDATKTIRTNEHGGALKTWSHTIHVEPTGDATCHYTDVIELDAGALTPIAYPIVNAFFAHRQRRWRKLASER